MARDSVRRGHHVVIDTVATNEDVRRAWRDLARATGSSFIAALCVCGDENVHRARLESRQRGIEGWPELEWSDVERVALRFEPWLDEHITLDAVNALEDNLAAAAAFIRAAQARAIVEP